MAATPQQYLIHLQIYKILQTILESHSTSGSTSVASSYAILLLRSAALFSTRAALFSTLHDETRQLYGVSKETRHGETPIASLERCHLTASAMTKNVWVFSSLVGQGRKENPLHLQLLPPSKSAWHHDPKIAVVDGPLSGPSQVLLGPSWGTKCDHFKLWKKIRPTRSRSVSLSPRFTIPGEDFFQHWHTNESA